VYACNYINRLPPKTSTKRLNACQIFNEGGFIMGLAIIFALVTLLAGYGTFTALKNKNLLGIVFAGGTFLVLGWFTVMTVLNHGFPVAH
jgi:cytochrome c biogenesis protein CcdA